MSSSRIAGLDGLRGIAVLAVVGFHVWPSWFPAGFLGVNLFFVLSGFLVTRAFTGDRDRTPGLLVADFWRRRLLRLIPAELLLLLIVWCAWSWSGWSSDSLTFELRLALAQASNWLVVVTPDYYVRFPTPVSHLWSLSIEMQLYLVLTVLMVVLRRNRTALTTICATNIAVVLSLSAAGAFTYNIAYTHTFTRSAEFAFGVLLALWADPDSDRRHSGWLRWPLMGAAASFVLVIMLLDKDSPLVTHGALPLVGALSCGLVWMVLALSDRSPGFLARGLLPHVGRISYGVYLYHWPLFLALARSPMSMVPRGMVTILLTAVVAETSFRYFEMPFQRLARRSVSQEPGEVRTRSSG